MLRVTGCLQRIEYIKKAVEIHGLPGFPFLKWSTLNPWWISHSNTTVSCTWISSFCCSKHSSESWEFELWKSGEANGKATILFLILAWLDFAKRLTRESNRTPNKTQILGNWSNPGRLRHTTKTEEGSRCWKALTWSPRSSTQREGSDKVAKPSRGRQLFLPPPYQF